MLCQHAYGLLLNQWPHTRLQESSSMKSSKETLNNTLGEIQIERRIQRTERLLWKWPISVLLYVYFYRMIYKLNIFI